MILCILLCTLPVLLPVAGELVTLAIVLLSFARGDAYAVDLPASEPTVDTAPIAAPILPVPSIRHSCRCPVTGRYVKAVRSVAVGIEGADYLARFGSIPNVY